MIGTMHKVFAGAALSFTMLAGAAQVQAGDNYRSQPAAHCRDNYRCETPVVPCRETYRCEKPVVPCRETYRCETPVVPCRETYRCEPPVRVKVCHYRWEECKEIQRVPYTRVVTRHDKCGHCCEEKETCYRNVTVVVKKRVPYYE